MKKIDRGRLYKAYNAMRALGVSSKQVKPVLYQLLALYEDDWGFIEADSYRALADAVFDEPPLNMMLPAPEPGKRKRDASSCASPSEAGCHEPYGKNGKRKRDASSSASPSEADCHEPYRKKLRSYGTEDQVTSASTSRWDGPVLFLPSCGKASFQASAGSVQGKKRALMSTEDPLIVEDELCETEHFIPLSVVLPPPSEARPEDKREGMKVSICDDNLDKGKDRELAKGRSPWHDLDDVSGGEEAAPVSRKLPKDRQHEDERMGKKIVVYDSNLEVANTTALSKDWKPWYDSDDVTGGEEAFMISVQNDVNDEKLPHFRYIARNIISRGACVKVSLASIGDENCCMQCFGDCVAASIPCACARETGGGYAYGTDGLLGQEFLDDCISMCLDLQKKHLFCYKKCYLSNVKNKEESKCKGHQVRRFIKECWSKCGCNKQCGNRVVQRGIQCNMQIFFTSEEKGWGLRTFDELARGTFVCEYVGEILTIMELYDRQLEASGSEKHANPVLLDADWGSERILKDTEALCLDATCYGNVARFINHRCSDANLIGIPVEVEKPDRHYYHLAFFTTRKVDAMEELTWVSGTIFDQVRPNKLIPCATSDCASVDKQDYGVDFGNHDHPIKAFHCHCGSKFCRDPKGSAKTRSPRSKANLKKCKGISFQ